MTKSEEYILLNSIFSNINKIIKKHSNLKFEFLDNKKLEDSKINSNRGSFFINENLIKNHTFNFGTTGSGVSSFNKYFDEMKEKLISKIADNIISKYEFNDIIIVLNKKEELIILSVFNFKNSSNYSEPFFNKNINYYKFAWIILNNEINFISEEEINENNFDYYLKLLNIVNY